MLDQWDPVSGRILTVAKEPRLGSVRIGADGSVWKKTRKLGLVEWEQATVSALSAARIGSTPSYDEIQAMGFTLVKAAKK